MAKMKNSKLKEQSTRRQTKNNNFYFFKNNNSSINLNVFTAIADEH